MPPVDVRVRMDFDASGSFGATVAGDAWAAALFLAVASYEASDPYEDVTERVRVTTPIVVKRGRDFARELAPIRAGTTDLLLGNEDGLYSSKNAASPLFGLVKSGRLIDVDVDYGGDSYDIASAYTNEPEEQPLLSQRSVRVYALDGLGRAGAAKIYTDRYASIRIDAAIGVVLDAIGWPAGLRSLDAAATTVTGWFVAGVTAFQALKDLVLSEGPGAMLYVDGAGSVVFESRHYRLLTTRSTTSQATFRDQGAEPLMSRFSVVPGESGIVNRATIPVRSDALAALAPVWTGPTPLVIQPGGTYTATVSTTEAAFDNAVNPTAGAGDFTVTAGSVASATLDRDGGKTATLTVVAGAGGATLTGLRVRAQTVTITEQLVSNTIDAAQSILDHGVQTLPDESTPKWVPTVNEAIDFANAVVGRNKTERAQVVVGINNLTEERLVQALSRRISDRVTAIDTSPVASFDDDVVVEAVEYRFDSHGDVFEATLYGEEARSQAYWVLGVAGYSELGDTTTLGY